MRSFCHDCVSVHYVQYLLYLPNVLMCDMVWNLDQADLDDLDEDADSRTQDTGEDDDAESLDSLGHIPRPYRDRARYERDRSRRRGNPMHLYLYGM